MLRAEASWWGTGGLETTSSGWLACWLAGCRLICIDRHIQLPSDVLAAAVDAWSHSSRSATDSLICTKTCRCRYAHTPLNTITRGRKEVSTGQRLHLPSSAYPKLKSSCGVLLPRLPAAQHGGANTAG
eukprot:GHVU01090787.1.p2 GENE.GHVU01090787.1~~GHVU01090787.1.p2  ORF type:complete len:128 (+),score=1.27 GHVU01090787.1:737-1120(+)